MEIIQNINIGQQEIERIVSTLNDGGLIVYPGKNGYLIGADITNPQAIEKIYVAKGRPRNKQLTSMVDSLEMVDKYGFMAEKDKDLYEKLMPGKIILVLKKKDTLIETPATTDEFAFTLPNYEIISQILQGFKKPITATSCNLAGQPIHTNIAQIEKEIEQYIDLAIDNGELAIEPDYTVVDLFNGINIRRFGTETTKALNHVSKDYQFILKD